MGVLEVATKYIGTSKSPSLAFMIPCFGLIIDALETEPPNNLEESQEKELRKTAMDGGKQKIKKYYSHTVENPYYTIAMCKFNLSIIK